jgi:hypothetical protein
MMCSSDTSALAQKELEINSTKMLLAYRIFIAAPSFHVHDSGVAFFFLQPKTVSGNKQASARVRGLRDMQFVVFYEDVDLECRDVGKLVMPHNILSATKMYSIEMEEVIQDILGKTNMTWAC